MALLWRWLASALAIFLVSALGLGIRVSSFGTALLAALVLGLANLLIRPILVFLTLPINAVTLGLFTLVINGLIYLIVSWVVPGFTVRGLLGGILASFLVGLATAVLTWLFRSL